MAEEFNHDHEFDTPIGYAFEDVLVNEKIGCGESPHPEGPACSASITVQWEVDFSNIEERNSGRLLSESEANTVWDQVIETYGTTFEFDYEKYKSGGSTLFKDRDSGLEVIVQKKTDSHADFVVTVGGTEYILHTSKYRVLD